MADIAMMKTPAETGLAQAFETARASLPGDGAAREHAFRRFAERGLPHRRVEEFKYTDLRALMREAAPLAPRPSADDAKAASAGARALAEVAAVRLTIVNGHLVSEESDLDRLPEGVEVVPLAAALALGHPLLGHMGQVAQAWDNPVYQLNAAFMFDGAVVRVGAGRSVEEPIHLRFVNAGASSFATATRTLVLVEEGASVILLESHAGQDGVAYQANDVVEVVAGDRSKVSHVRLNAEGQNALALSTLTVQLGGHAAFRGFNGVIGSGVARHQVYLAFAGEGSLASLNGAAMLRGRQHADTTLLLDHLVPHCESRVLFKTVLDDDATGVFQGKIIVEPHAQKTDGRMMSAALLLSDGGTMNNKPELEIFADDVQCGHGATSGALDEDLLFYLMARGLPRSEAESLLVQAFLGEPIEAVDHEGAREALVGVVEDWLGARG